MTSPAPALSLEQRQHWTARVLGFLADIGQPFVLVDDADRAEGFLPHIRVERGVLHIHGDVFPGDILHEAGHLCTMPEHFRRQASGNLYEVFGAMCQFIEKNNHLLAAYPECKFTRALMQCSDPEATAWQYAAAMHLGMPDEAIFPPGSYGPGGPESTLFQLKNRAYIGINGLQAAGWTTLRGSQHNPCKAVYPELAFWRHPAGLPTEVAEAA